jgi:hypothetical protein
LRVVPATSDVGARAIGRASPAAVQSAALIGLEGRSATLNLHIAVSKNQPRFCADALASPRRDLAVDRMALIRFELVNPTAFN